MTSCAGVFVQGAEQYAQPMLATSPAAYSSTSPRDTAGRRIVAAPLRRKAPVTPVSRLLLRQQQKVLSQSLSHCFSSVTPSQHKRAKPLRTVRTGVLEGVRLWMDPAGGLGNELSQRSTSLVTSDCLKYNPDFTSSSSKSQLCAGTCSLVSPQLSKGNFEYRPITAAWKAQRHIP